MKLFLCPNAYNEAQLSQAESCVRTLTSKCGHRLAMYSGDRERLLQAARDLPADCISDCSPEDCELIVSLGGDGSMLRAARTAVRSGRPLVGVNSGRRGYLCAMEIGELDAFDAILSGCSRSSRMLLEITAGGAVHCALNDIVVAKKNYGETVDLTVTISGGDTAHLRADGLILATPTGSTAYNLSAGGPVLDPETELTVLTPVCAHGAFGHSVVLPGSTSVLVSERSDQASVYADGQFICDLSGALEVRRSGQKLTLLTRNGFLRDLAGL